MCDQQWKPNGQTHAHPKWFEIGGLSEYQCPASCSALGCGSGSWAPGEGYCLGTPCSLSVKRGSSNPRQGTPATDTSGSVAWAQSPQKCIISGFLQCSCRIPSMPTSHSLCAQGSSCEDLPQGRPAVTLGSLSIHSLWHRPLHCLPIGDDKELCPRPACGREPEPPGKSIEGWREIPNTTERGKLQLSPVFPQPSVAPPGQGAKLDKSSYACSVLLGLFLLCRSCLSQQGPRHGAGGHEFMSSTTSGLSKRSF